MTAVKPCGLSLGAFGSFFSKAGKGIDAIFYPLLKICVVKIGRIKSFEFQFYINDIDIFREVVSEIIFSIKSIRLQQGVIFFCYCDSLLMSLIRHAGVMTLLSYKEKPQLYVKKNDAAIFFLPCFCQIKMCQNKKLVHVLHYDGIKVQYYCFFVSAYIFFSMFSVTFFDWKYFISYLKIIMVRFIYCINI